MIKTKSHYDWLEENLQDFFNKLELVNSQVYGDISTHGDKCYC